MHRYDNSYLITAFSLLCVVFFVYIASAYPVSHNKVIIMALLQMGMAMFRDATGKSLLFNTISMFLVGYASNYWIQLGLHENIWMNLIFVICVSNGVYCTYLEIKNAKFKTSGQDFTCKTK